MGRQLILNRKKTKNFFLFALNNFNRKIKLLTESLLVTLHKHFPCRNQADVTYTPGSDLPLLCNFCPCWCRTKCATDGMEPNNVTSANGKIVHQNLNYEQTEKKKTNEKKDKHLFDSLTLISNALLMDALRWIFDSPRSICFIIRSMSFNSWHRSQNT